MYKTRYNPKVEIDFYEAELAFNNERPYKEYIDEVDKEVV